MNDAQTMYNLNRIFKFFRTRTLLFLDLWLHGKGQIKQKLHITGSTQI